MFTDNPLTEKNDDLSDLDENAELNSEKNECFYRQEPFDPITRTINKPSEKKTSRNWALNAANDEIIWKLHGNCTTDALANTQKSFVKANLAEHNI